MRLALLSALCSASIVAGCVEISGERDVLEGHMVRNQPYEGFPQPSPGQALPLVMIVGPPGATECWSAQLPEAPPWRGTVDQDRTVTVATPPLAQGETIRSYECAVRDAGDSRPHVVTRHVQSVDLPLDPELRQRRHAEQIERRRELCQRDPASARRFGLSCDLGALQYEPERRLHPLIVHVGAPDSRARQRWDELRERLDARCNLADASFVERATRDDTLCELLTDGTWEALEAADLGAAAPSP